MKLTPKKMLANAAPVLIGTGLIVLNGVFVMSGSDEIVMQKEAAPRCAENSYHGEYRADEEAAEVVVLRQAAASSAETKAVKTYTAVDITLPQQNVSVRKAKIGDYTMLMQVDLPKKKASSKKKSSKKAEKAEEVVAFDAVYKEDTTTIYDPHPEKMAPLKTRSVADEYFNVFDERSGSYCTLDGHEMLCRIIANEIGSEWGDEAMKAQIVAAYSYLCFCAERGIVPTVGLNSGYDKHIEDLVSSVEGQAVFYDGKIINAVYSASTAGYSVESGRMWEMDYPYLKCVVSEYDKEDPYYGQETVLSKAEVKAALENTCGIVMSDNAENWFKPEDIYSGRYVGYITIDGQKRITCRTLQNTFDLQSQAVRIEISGDNVIIRTFGWGHGVGMSQWGAKGYAAHGWSYDQILRHYYVDTDVKLTRRASADDNTESKND